MDEEEFGFDNPGNDLEETLELLKSKREADDGGDSDDETPDEDADEGDEPSEDEEGDEAPEEDSDEETEDDGEDDGEEGDEPPAKKPSRADDEAEVEVVVDGKAQAFKVKDLKRLAGQEAALTQRSQAVAAQNRAIEAQGLHLANVLDAQWKAAQAQAAKYKDVDLIQASRTLDEEEYTALRDAKVAAEQQFQAIDAEARQFIDKARTTRQAFLREQAKVALPIITQRIPEWNDQVYNDVRAYAISKGMPKEQANEVVDPALIVMMHTAMAAERKQAASKAKVETVAKKVAKAPKKVVSKSGTTNAQPQQLKALARRAADNGDEDSVVAYLEAKRRSNR